MPDSNNASVKVSVPSHQTRKVPRQPDGDGFFAIYSGGMRAAEAADNAWFIEPVLEGRDPSAKGVMSRREVQAFFSQYAFTFIAFHGIGWLKGDYHSSWSPFIPGQANHFLGPADLWSNVASNFSRARTADDIAKLLQPTREQIAALLDDRGEAERLARSISLSLRNMDISVEQIAEFYNEQLVSHMAAGRLKGERSTTTLDQTLYAHVHSFFMHLGAARDYLAALCALRIGKDPQKVDSFARLVEAVRHEHFDRDPILGLLRARGYLQVKSPLSSKFEAAGWMAEVTDLRNEFMHRRPYGDRFVEHTGYAEAVHREASIYRYIRPIVLNGSERDVQDVVTHHYREITGLCYEAAQMSGDDLTILTLTDDDIISVDGDG
jgi:hypothetical protein